MQSDNDASLPGLPAKRVLPLVALVTICIAFFWFIWRIFATPLPQARTLQGRTDKAWFMDWSPDGARLVTGDRELLYVWNIKAGRLERRLILDTPCTLLSVSWSSDGGYIASGATDHSVLVWNAHEAETDNPPTEKNIPIYVHKRFRPSTSVTSSIVAIKPLLHLHRFGQRSIGTPFHDVAFAPDDGSTLGTAGTVPEGVALWHLPVATRPRIFSYGKGEIDGYAVAFSRDGATVAAGGWRGVRLWNRTTGKTLSVLPDSGNIYRLAYSPNGRYIAGVDLFTGLRVWDTATGKQTGRCAMKTNGSLSWTRDSRAVIAGDAWHVSLYDPHSVQRRGYLITPSPPLSPRYSAFRFWLWRFSPRLFPLPTSPRNETIGSFALSPDGETLAYSGQSVSPHGEAIRLLPLR